MSWFNNITSLVNLKDNFFNLPQVNRDAPYTSGLFQWGVQRPAPLSNNQPRYVFNNPSYPVYNNTPVENLVDLNSYAQDVLKGRYGTGANRITNLTNAGLNPEQIKSVQDLVNYSIKNNVPINAGNTATRTASTATSGASKYIPTGKQDFIDTMLPYAQAAAERLGIDPYIIISQAALETGWGKHAPNNNYFGIKGKGGTFKTTEYVGGKPVTINDSFKGYRTMEDSVNGYADFILNNKRYADAIGLTDARKYINTIAGAGYATDPEYANRVYAIYSGIKPRN